MSPEKPLTELINHKTNNIDVASPLEIVSLLKSCDDEIFKGWEKYPNLYHERIQTNLDAVVDVAVNLFKNPSKNSIILSGCGTSGRLAFLAVRTLNEKLKSYGIYPCFDYLLAGGDTALFTSKESGEDNPVKGRDMLIEATKGKKKVLFIGITCGFSAPFVAGQIDYCMQKLDKFIPVLIGFNPVKLARDLYIEKLDKTFLKVIQDLNALEGSKKGFIINPIIGPEPIAGSSRMKGGTATKLLLESIFVSVFSQLKGQKIIPQLVLNSYETVYENVYADKEQLAVVIKLAGKSLNNGGSIYYVGWDSLGIMGLIDASECPPTYGASLDDVRGFLHNGYLNLGNKEGSLSQFGKHFQISLEDFNNDVLPSLKEEDIVILLTSDGNFIPDSNLVMKPCTKVLVVVNISEEKPSVPNPNIDIFLKVTINHTEITELTSKETFEEFKQLYYELAVKWILNSVSTGAHVLVGKVYQNIMIDLKPSNNKLFHRAVNILQNFTGLPAEVCKEYLIRSIYEKDELSRLEMFAPIAYHIEVAAKRNKVVPVALISCLLNCSVEEAKKHIAKEPVLRTVILSVLKYSK